MKLLNIQKEIPDILLDIRYCTTYNFIGEIIDGYIDPEHSAPIVGDILIADLYEDIRNLVVEYEASKK